MNYMLQLSQNASVKNVLRTWRENGELHVTTVAERQREECLANLARERKLHVTTVAERQRKERLVNLARER